MRGRGATDMGVWSDMASGEVPLGRMKKAHVRAMLKGTAEVHIDLWHCGQVGSLLIAILQDIHITPVREGSGREEGEGPRGGGREDEEEGEEEVEERRNKRENQEAGSQERKREEGQR